jgi:mono/diheme cytochrome c family protein
MKGDTDMLNREALILAALTATFCLACSLSGAQLLQIAARRTSRQQPIEEHWFEAPSPTSPALVARGRKLFLESCAHCHGADASGDEGPDLHGLQVSDRFITATVTRGIKGEMPSFSKKMKSGDLTALTAYVRALE